MLTRKLNDEVLFAEREIRAFSDADMDELRNGAKANPSGKLRICLHRSPDDTLHEMAVALRKDVKYPPHRHLRSEESYVALYGRAILLVFSESGAIQERLPLGDGEKGDMRYARIPAMIYHCLEIQSEVFVFLETKLGPFRAEDSEAAPFAIVNG